MVLAELGCDPTDPDTGLVPEPVVIVTSRIVARVLTQNAAMSASLTGATAATDTAGPFSQTRQYPAGLTSGQPWMTKADREVLAPYQCAAASGKAFEIDTVPPRDPAYPWWWGCA